MVRVGVVGFGYWGPNLARNLREAAGGHLAAIADSRPERRALAAKKHPGVPLYADAGELIASADVDAVAIATPVSTHFELGLSTLKSGKDLLVEKPLAGSAAEAARLVEMAERDGRVLMVDHTYVYTGATDKIAQLIDSGEIGDVCYYDSIRINLGLYQDDVSVVWDLAVHDISMLQFLLRRRFETVQATGGRHLGSARESVAHLTLGLAGGVQAHVNVSWISPVKIRQTILVGDRKMVLYDDLEPDEKVKVYDRGITFDAERRPSILPEYRIGDMYAPRIDRREPLARVCEHFIECVEQRRRPLSSGLEGLEIVRVLEAADRSLAEHGRQVRL